MSTIFAAILIAGSLNAAPAPIAPSVASPTLPGSPRAVTLTCTSGACVLSWQAPTSSGATPLTGYVVIAGDTATYVGADVTRLTAASPDATYAVASMNGVGSSVATKAKVASGKLRVASRTSRDERAVSVAAR